MPGIENGVAAKASMTVNAAAAFRLDKLSRQSRGIPAVNHSWPATLARETAWRNHLMQRFDMRHFFAYWIQNQSTY